MGSGYLWVKAFHIVFVAAWFAALFYLPRLMVNLGQVRADSTAEFERLQGMGQRLYRFGTLLMIPALALGLWLWLGYGVGGSWLHAKLVLVLAMTVRQAPLTAIDSPSSSASKPARPAVPTTKR